MRRHLVIAGAFVLGTWVGSFVRGMLGEEIRLAVPPVALGAP